MDSGQLDLRGLAIAAAQHGLGRIMANTGIKIADEDIAALVPSIMKQIGLPEMIEVGLAGMALGRVALAGYARQQAINRSHENAGK